MPCNIITIYNNKNIVTKNSGQLQIRIDSETKNEAKEILRESIVSAKDNNRTFKKGFDLIKDALSD